MNPSTPPPSPEAVKLPRTMEGLEPDETLVVEIHKHPFGLFSLYIAAVVGLIGAALLAVFLIPQLVSGDQLATADKFVWIALVIAAMLTIVGLLVATYVYRQSRLIISNKNVTQVIQRSLFSRKVSELSMSNVEDVTADKNGILAAIFNFGTLNIETAGEVENFIFTYCPNPNYYGKVILEARQKYADSIQENPFERR